MKLWQTHAFEQITLVRGEGCTVYDEAGNSYLDLLSGTWCNVLGYNHPRLIETIVAQASKLIHVGAPYSTGEISRALSKLQEVLPPKLNRAVFLNTGSEAVELALKMARAAAGTDGIVVSDRGYYGATNYSMALSEVGYDASYLPRIGEIHRLPAPTCRDCPMGCSWPCEDFPCLEALRILIDRNQTRIAAVLYEPVMAVGGMVVPPAGYGACLRDLTTRAGALLISEEVTTGVGRTGRWFGFEHDQITPDILVIGKAIGAGLPVSVVVTTQQVEARCQSVLRHVQSHQNDPFSGQIAARVISILQDEQLVDAAAERGTYLLEGLRSMRSRLPWIRDVRGKGLMLGIEIGRDQAQAGKAVARRLLQLGFIIDYQPKKGIFCLFPPYTISMGEIDRFLTSFESVVLEYI